MNTPYDTLVKLAEELTNRVDSLEQENHQLKLQSKEASAVVQAKASVVDSEVAQATCLSLVKFGALNVDQMGAAKEIFMRDPNAAHRTICSIIDATTQVKNASEATEQNLAGGSLVGGKIEQVPSSGACLARMEAILGMSF